MRNRGGARGEVGGTATSESRFVLAGIAAFVLLVVALSAAVVTATVVAVVLVPLGLLLMPVAMLVLRHLARRQGPPRETQTQRRVISAPRYASVVRPPSRTTIVPPVAVEPQAAEDRKAA